MYRRMMISLALLCSLFITLPGLPGQSPAADEVFAQARQLVTDGKSGDAIPEFTRALAVYREKKDRHGEAMTLHARGSAYDDLSEYDHALDDLNLALAIRRNLGERLDEGKTLSLMGLIYWEKGDFPKSVDYSNQALTIAREVKDQKLEGSALNNLGLALDDQGDFARSLEIHKQALELQRAAHFERGEADALGNMGGWYLLQGRFREGIPFYEHALEIDERSSLTERASLDLGNIALAQTGLGQLGDAVHTFDRAIGLAREAGSKSDEADWHKGKGSAYVNLGKYDLARDEFRQAIKTYEAAGLKQPLIEGLEDEGNLYELLGDYASAEKNFRRALETSRAIGHQRGVTNCLTLLGDLEWRQKRYDQAAALYQEAYGRAKEVDDRGAMAGSLVSLALTLRDQGRPQEGLPRAQQALEMARATGASLAEAQALFALGELERKSKADEKAITDYSGGLDIAQKAGQTELEWQLAYGKGQSLENLGRDDDAVASYRQAVTVIESVSNQLREERFQAGYIENKYQVYVALVRLLLKQGKTKEAFFYSEKLRARSYQDLLNKNQAPVSSTREADLRARIRRLQQQIDHEEAKPRAEEGRQKMLFYSGELAAAERDYQAFLDDLRSAHPQSPSAEMLAVPATEEMQGALPADAALVEYIVGDSGVSIFVLTREGLRAKTIAVSAANLQSKVELFRDLLVHQGSRDWVAPGESLYGLVIAPIEQDNWLEGVRRLVLVPHGVLHYLPFAALPRPESKGAHLLIQDYVVAYLPAASALVYGRESQAPQREVLAMAPSNSLLRFAPQEARVVGSFYPKNSLILVGSGATEVAFEKRAGDYKMIHLAAHGFFDRLNPVFSGLQLEPTDHDDGRLLVYEILRLRLHAQLVTLSACETALGSGYFSEYPAGDDIVGLTRAFMYAGSTSVMASLWEVNDRSTMQFMRSFYRNLQQDDEASALRQTQLAMLESHGRYSQPYFWAPFVLVGSEK